MPSNPPSLRVTPAVIVPDVDDQKAAAANQKEAFVGPTNRISASAPDPGQLKLRSTKPQTSLSNAAEKKAGGRTSRVWGGRGRGGVVV